MTNTNETTDKTIFGVFTPNEVNSLREEYQLKVDQEVILRKIATPLFRKYNIRTFDEGSQEAQDDIRYKFLAIQANVVTKTAIKHTLVQHRKGDPMRNPDGVPMTDGTNADGTPRFVTYSKDKMEWEPKEMEVPFYDHKNSSSAWRDINRLLRAIEVLPDYDELKTTYLKTVDFERGCDLIRNLTKYYIFDEPDKFVERFALLICNAKAKALGHQPKWPVLFSLVGKMGVGKSWLAQMVKETYDASFGCRSQVTSYGRLLDGHFNSMMMTRGFLSIDEAQGLDKAQCEKLKTYITSPQVDIERKGVDVKTCDNLVTFFSTTNESVKDVMGYQSDRRIIEFEIKAKKGEISENDIRDWLEELWLVMPIEHPTQQLIKDQLLTDSTMVLDVKMEEIVFDLFNGNEAELFNQNNKRLHQFKFKRAVKELGGVPYARVLDWCLDKGILRKDTTGHICVRKRELDAFLDAHLKENDSPCYSSKPSIPSDMKDNLFGTERN